MTKYIVPLHGVEAKPTCPGDHSLSAEAPPAAFGHQSLTDGEETEAQFERALGWPAHQIPHISSLSPLFFVPWPAQNILILLSALCDLEHDNTVLLFQGGLPR